MSWEIRLFPIKLYLTVQRCATSQSLRGMMDERTDLLFHPQGLIDMGKLFKTAKPDESDEERRELERYEPPRSISHIFQKFDLASDLSQKPRNPDPSTRKAAIDHRSPLSRRKLLKRPKLMSLQLLLRRLRKRLLHQPRHHDCLRLRDVL